MDLLRRSTKEGSLVLGNDMSFDMRRDWAFIGIRPVGLNNKAAIRAMTGFWTCEIGEQGGCGWDMTWHLTASILKRRHVVWRFIYNGCHLPESTAYAPSRALNSRWTHLRAYLHLGHSARLRLTEETISFWRDLVFAVERCPCNQTKKTGSQMTGLHLNNGWLY